MNPVPVSLPFADRAEAGRRLADRVRALAVTDPIVVALPHGGIAVGAELARRLRLPLDVLVVREIGLPGHPELGVGAIAEDGRVCFDDAILARLGVPRERFAATVAAEQAELARRLEVYRAGGPAPRLTGRDVIVVDDGAATGGTARAALRMARRQKPARLVLAVPVASPAAVEGLRSEADHLVVLTVPENFRAVREWYRDFGRPADEQVSAVLSELRDLGPGTESERAVRVRARDVHLDGDLVMPSTARGAVVFALGRERASPRLRAVAAAVRQAGHATLLLDLVTEEEARLEEEPAGEGPRTALLAERLEAAVRWLRRAAAPASRPVGLFGADAGSAAALVAAANRAEDIAAVVTYGGRIDLAGTALPGVRAPTLVLLESGESFLRELAEWALGRIGAPHEIRAVPGTERLLGRPGEWREAGTAAAEWFGRHL
ncbi:phosphoribosyltransferase family protein [Marinitenerispora sediminis]|uniref:Phosphoribosyl transferase n=1 Tax=Marinitenerispora sediminis TaxID=1931232 RepID=A0A368T032_9ACTN|nr:phosphoribosyltransferase family protein [Marinitenerispora sediminis]RCV48296.1 phosphoribosyl transferase [Marinitenerispora sediminis]RCV49467.1 phosphoribosyl transferase [Marinitenerispora sediminis]RCV52230.1 phosphoribosyl transferase [Marinitenerispora sediminis]